MFFSLVNSLGGLSTRYGEQQGVTRKAGKSTRCGERWSSSLARR